MAGRLPYIASVLTAGLLFAAAPAVAGDYRYCRADGTAMSLVRTLKRDGGFAFQTTVNGHIVAKSAAGLGAYLAWRGSPSRPPRLWVTRKGYFEFVPSESRLIFYTSGKDEDVSLGHARPGGSVDVFEVDPAALLERFAGQPRVRIGFRSPKGKRLRTRGWLDLDALRAELAEAGRLSSELDAPGRVCLDTMADLPQEANLSTYECSPTDHDPTMTLSLWATRIRWASRISPNLYFSADVFGGEQGFDEDSPRPMLQGRFVDLLLRPVYTGAYYRRTGVIVELGTGAQTIAVSLDETVEAERRARQVLTWDRLRALEANGSIPFLVRDAKGVVVERAALQPGLFANSEQRMRALLRRQRAMMEDPLEQCAPPEDIVVT